MGVTLPWSIRTLDQNDLGLQSALKALKPHVDAAGDQNLAAGAPARRAAGRPARPTPDTAPTPVGARNATGAPAVAAAATAQAPAAAPAEPIRSSTNPDEAYRTEIKQALMDAMLDYSGPLCDCRRRVADDRRARRRRRRAAGAGRHGREADASSSASTAADLAAFRAGRIARDEALKRMEVRVF